ncbi:MAG TPA: ATP-binding protein [Anaerolineae bacterium]|nr:ATP-binding protein [Anaerolineae bacterium]
MLHSLRALLGAICFGLLSLVAISVIITFVAASAQAEDALAISLASRQRTLGQQAIALALTRPDSPELAQAIQLFDQTLHALRDGGASLDSTGHSVTLAPAPDAELRAQLEQAIQAWAGLSGQLRTGDAGALQVRSPVLLAQLDGIVSAFESRAGARMTRLHLIQLVCLAAALLLIALGYLVTRRRLFVPLAALTGSARRMAASDFDQPVSVHGDDELGQVAQAFETLRTAAAAAHQDLEARVTQRTRELASAFEFSQEIVAHLDLQRLLRSVTDRARALTRSEAASLCLLDADGQQLILAATNATRTVPHDLRQPLPIAPAAQVVGAGQTIRIETACSTCGLLHAYAPGQCIAAPLQVADQVLGALCVVRGEGAPFDADETRALTLLANSAAIAIANARLVEAGRQQAQEAATLAERERLAADLHDHLAQTLSFLNLKIDRIKDILAAGRAAETAAELEQMKSAVGGAYGQVRAALVGLREPEPAADDLAEKLDACVAEFRATSGLPAELIIANPDALALPQVAQTQALSIVREALINVRRHAQAHRVRVHVERANGETVIAVEDDGRGFKPSTLDGGHHLGLTIMQARAERVGGRLTIESAPASGTRVVARFPLGQPQTSEVSETSEV